MIAQRRAFLMRIEISAALQHRMTRRTKSSSPSAITGKPRINPSAASCSTQRMISSATLSGVPIKPSREWRLPAPPRATSGSFLRPALDAVGRRAKAVPCDLQVRKWLIQRINTEIMMIKEAPEIGERHPQW